MKLENILHSLQPKAIENINCDKCAVLVKISANGDTLEDINMEAYELDKDLFSPNDLFKDMFSDEYVKSAVAIGMNPDVDMEAFNNAVEKQDLKKAEEIIESSGNTMMYVVSSADERVMYVYFGNLLPAEVMLVAIQGVLIRIVNALKEDDSPNDVVSSMNLSIKEKFDDAKEALLTCISKKGTWLVAANLDTEQMGMYLLDGSLEDFVKNNADTVVQIGSLGGEFNQEDEGKFDNTEDKIEAVLTEIKDKNGIPVIIGMKNGRTFAVWEGEAGHAIMVAGILTSFLSELKDDVERNYFAF